MTTNPENIDTSAERVRKNPIAELMRDAAEYIYSRTLDSDQVTPVYHELMQAAHDIEQQEPLLAAHFADASKMDDLHEKIQEIVTSVYDREYQIDDAARDIVDLIPNGHPTVTRDEITKWRDDALEQAAQICDRYGLDAYGAGHDIRVLKSDYKFAPHNMHKSTSDDVCGAEIAAHRKQQERRNDLLVIGSDGDE